MSALQELFEYSTEAIFGIDENRKIRFWNKSCENLLRVSSQKAMGKCCADLLCGKDLKGNRICTKGCPIVEHPDLQVFGNRFHLVLESGDKKPVEVIVGSYFINESSRKNNNDIQVFHSIRPVIRHERESINAPKSGPS